MSDKILIGWLIGFFVVFSPLHMIKQYNPIYSLVDGIIGVLVAIIMVRCSK